MSRRQSVILSFANSNRSGFGFDLLGQTLEFLGAHDERSEVETESELNLPSPALSRVALAVRAVAANDQSGVHQHRKHAASRSRRHAVRPEA